MKSQKKFFVVLALTGLIPLVMVFVFFIYRIGQHAKEGQNSYEKYFDSSGRIPESILQQLAESLSQHLRQTGWSKEPDLLREQEIGYIQKFREQHPEFEEIILKNPQTGTVYLTVPDRAEGEKFIGVRLVVTVPVLTDSQTVLLSGFINLKRPALHRNQPALNKNQVGIEGKGAATASATNKKIAMLLALFLTFVIVSIPITMFFFYRKIKKIVSLNSPDSSHVSTVHENRTYSGKGRRRE